MKLIARFILFIFVAFLTTPTIVMLIENNNDLSMFFSFAEEENYKDLKDMKADIKVAYDYPIVEITAYQNSKIISENLTRHDNATEEIFIPPPELI